MQTSFWGIPLWGVHVVYIQLPVGLWDATYRWGEVENPQTSWACLINLSRDLKTLTGIEAHLGMAEQNTRDWEIEDAPKIKIK